MIENVNSGSGAFRLVTASLVLMAATSGCVTTPQVCDLSTMPLDPPVLEAPAGEPTNAVPAGAAIHETAADPAEPAASDREPDSNEPREPVQTAGAAHDYRIHPFDDLHIEVFGEADISRVYSVSTRGDINHPLLKRVPLEGMTLREAEKKITDLLARDFLVEPRVSITVEKSTFRRVTVLGEVKQPGTYAIAPDRPMSLLTAVAQAGGFTDIAALSRVRVIRRSDKEENAIRVNVADLLKGHGNQQDLALESGDVVMVPETIF